VHGRTRLKPRKYRAYTRKDIDAIPQLDRVAPRLRTAMKAVSAVLPFRVNDYVLDELIRWEDVPDDPIFRLTFPQPEMLEPGDLRRMVDLVREEAPPAALKAEARAIQDRLNPHPAGQMTLNVPRLDGAPVAGMQHKYRETVLFFPSQGQTCHAYCTYCFRWAQFVGIESLKFASREAQTLVRYLRAHREVRSVLITGGDPLIMKTATLRRYVEPLLTEPGLDHIASIRLGSKAPAYWPYRFVTDPDADDLLQLFEEVRAAGKHLALMTHFSHPREIETRVAAEGLRRAAGAGAVVRCQAPLMRGINDDPDVWADLWSRQVRLGAVPYYLFVARDTGPKGYFEVPLARAHDIFREACRRVSGLARTVRGPSMSALPGKVVVDGVADVAGERVFVLKLLQGRVPGWVGRPFFAAFDPEAAWLDHLRPAFGEAEFFYEAELRAVENGRPEPWRRSGRARGGDRRGGRRTLPVVVGLADPAGAIDRPTWMTV